MESNPRAKKILQFPLTRIILGLIVCTVPLAFCSILLDKVMQGAMTNTLQILGSALAVGSLVIFVYCQFYRFYEKRKITELSAKDFGRNIISGLLIGFIFQSLVVLVMFLAGDYTVISVNGIYYLVEGLSIAIVSGITEEIIFRGILFRIAEEKLGSAIALILSSAIFGAIHLSNPNGTFIGAINISLEAGLLLGAAYIYSRSLWLPMAIHFAWNFSESGIFGVPDSGITMENSLITSTSHGNAWITGGTFGPEASLQCLVFGGTAAFTFLYVCKKQNKFIRPFWVKPAPAPISLSSPDQSLPGSSA